MKKAEIKINVDFDENMVPKSINWSTSDNNGKKESCKSIMVSLWDSKSKNTSRIDLWTKDMPIDEMKFFFYQSIITMSETYMRATSDKKVADLIRNFAKKLEKEILT